MMAGRLEAFVAGLALVGLVSCGDSSSVADERCDVVSSPTQAVVHAKVRGRAFAGALVISHGVDGNVIERSMTDAHGCAAVASDLDSLVTVLFTTPAPSFVALTTLAPSTDELVVHGPHDAGNLDEPSAGQVTIKPGTVPSFEPITPGDSVRFGYDLGCTIDGCMRGDRTDPLPWTVDIPTRAATGAVTMTISADLSGPRCCDAHGQPFTLSVVKSATGTVDVSGGNASIDSTFAPQCPCDRSDCDMAVCKPGLWPAAVSPELMVDAGTGGTGEVLIRAEVESSSVSFYTVRAETAQGPPGSPCTLPSGELALCSAIEIPPGIPADHATLSYSRSTNVSETLVSRQITAIRSDGQVSIATTDVLPPIPPPHLFQDPERRVLAWPVAQIDADVVGILLWYSGGMWVVALPPSADHVSLPVDPALPTDPSSGTAFPLGLQMYADSDDLDGFPALMSAGIHVDLVSELITNQFGATYPITAMPIVPPPTTRLRMTSVDSAF